MLKYIFKCNGIKEYSINDYKNLMEEILNRKNEVRKRVLSKDLKGKKSNL